MSEKMELAEAGLRHADGLTAQLDKPDWRPSRAHIEQARNSIKKLAEMILVSSPAQEPVTTEPVAWRFKPKHSHQFPGWQVALDEPRANENDYIIEPLYAIPAPPQPGRDAVIEECVKAAREGYNQAIAEYVLVGPSGLAVTMINSIIALKEGSK